MESFLVLLGLAVLAVPVLLVVALTSVSQLKHRVAALEHALAMAAQPAAAPAVAPSVAPGRPSVPAADVASRAPAPSPPPRAVSAAAESPHPPRWPSGPDAPVDSAPRRMFPDEPRAPGVVERALRAARRWFTVGNVPVKVGMLVLLAGVAALLKYASDQGWLQVPVELRLAAISLAATAGLVFAWRARVRKPAFAVAVQGGAIGVLLLVVFAAFKLHALLPGGIAFALSIVLVAGLGVLAVLQDARTLAVLGILAGFLAPVWLSTGSGNHVALFAYYAVLNAAIFAIAWMRPWRVLNLLGFAFTWGIGIAWGVLAYRPEHYASTQPFLLLFFAFYLLLPVLHARRQPASRGDRIDGCLLFGTPLVAFSLQAALLDGARMPLALWALGVAAVYAALAWALVRSPRYAVLARAHALLAVGFATLAVPLALSAEATASVFALEGAALVWLGFAQGRRLPRWTGLGLQLAAAVAFAIGRGDWHGDAPAIANPLFMGALLVAVAGFASAWVTWRGGMPRAATAWYAWALAWWCGNAIAETNGYVVATSRADVLLAFAAFTGWLAAEVHRRRPAPAFVLTSLAAIVAAFPLALAQVAAHGHPFGGDGTWAWMAFAVLGVRALACLRAADDPLAPLVQLAWWLAWPTVLALLGLHVVRVSGLGGGWAYALAGLPWLALAATAQFRWSWLAVPLGKRFTGMRTPLQSIVFAVLAVGWTRALFDAGNAAPLPWMPLLNPLDLAQLAALVLAVRWLWSRQVPAVPSQVRATVLPLAGVALATCVALRGVHHWGGVPWDSALLPTSLAQTTLTLLWSVLGVAAWLAGSRLARRALWLSGAVLMAVVLAKLVLVDRQHLGNLLGIASFIAYGLLCTLVGWFAPAPPRATGVAAAGASA